MNKLDSNTKEKYLSFLKKIEGEEEFESTSGGSPPLCEMGALENGNKGGYGNGDWLNLRKGVMRLCRHPIFQLSKPAKKIQSLGIVNKRDGIGRAWA
uniref:Rho GTPase-activating protein 3-like isoform X1 n=1 Tax=Rhizophora mucronata TaxID=61149 RepID=A0A2P2KDP6_RHIMU